MLVNDTAANGCRHGSGNCMRRSHPPTHSSHASLHPTHPTAACAPPGSRFLQRLDSEAVQIGARRCAELQRGPAHAALVRLQHAHRAARVSLPRVRWGRGRQSDTKREGSMLPGNDCVVPLRASAHEAPPFATLTLTLTLTHPAQVWRLHGPRRPRPRQRVQALQQRGPGLRAPHAGGGATNAMRGQCARMQARAHVPPLTCAHPSPVARCSFWSSACVRAGCGQYSRLKLHWLLRLLLAQLSDAPPPPHP
jgi:hypothetical protein